MTPLAQGSDVALRPALAEAERRLAVAGVPSPHHDAEELAAHALGVERRELWRVSSLRPGAAVAFEEYVGRRAAREPLQHITGRAYFRHLVLAVGPGVFVPRPETEVVAGAAIAEARQVARHVARRPAAPRTPVVVDLATGSGAIALAVATEVPGARVHAVELDEAALSWARRNLHAHGEARIDLRAGDLGQAFPELDGQVDVVVSNPPYIPVDGVIRDPEVARHDPSLALWSGSDGLDAMRAVERTAARLLRPGGLVVVEHADLQGESAPAVFAATGRWEDVADHLDLAERPRYVTARRSPAPPQPRDHAMFVHAFPRP